MPKSRAQGRKPASTRPSADDSSRAGLETRRTGGGTTASVRLTRKYAEMIDGVDLTDANVGDELSLTERDALVLVAEGWAERSPRSRSSDVRSKASESSRSPGRKR